VQRPQPLAAGAGAEAVTVAGLRRIAEYLTAEDIQLIRKVVRAEPVQLLVDTVVLVAGTAEVDMVLALVDMELHRDWVQQHSGLLLAVECRKVEIVFHGSSGPCFCLRSFTANTDRTKTSFYHH